MDEKSTPIASLNNKNDESEVVNQILKKYNTLENADVVPNNINQMENNFENRDLNQEMYDLKSNNIVYKDHYEKELERTNTPSQHFENINDQFIEDEDEYEEYEVIQLPLWKKILNELRIPFFIIIFIIIFFNCSFDKFLISKFSILGNQFNDCNTYGFLLKAFLVSLISYIFIRFIRF